MPMIMPAGLRKIAIIKMKLPAISKNVPLPMTSKTLCNTVNKTKPKTELIMSMIYGFGFFQLCVNESIKSMLPINARIIPGGLSGMLTIKADTIDSKLSNNKMYVRFCFRIFSFVIFSPLDLRKIFQLVSGPLL